MSTGSAKSARIAFDTSNQKVESVQRVVAYILGKSGCNTCGRLINLNMEFQGDPAPDIGQGVLSLHTEGF
jgi:hypothetical protein